MLSVYAQTFMIATRTDRIRQPDTAPGGGPARPSRNGLRPAAALPRLKPVERPARRDPL